MSVRLLFVSAILSLSLQTIAGKTEDGHWLANPYSLSLHIDNDMFVQTDRYYTNGLRLSFLSRDLEEMRLPEWAKRVQRSVPLFDRAGYTNNIGLAVGQNMYTPRDITIAALQPDDHPWAGWLYLGLSLHHKSLRDLHKLELQLGVVGPESLADRAQILTHKIRNRDRPEGWENQLRTEPGIRLSYAYILRWREWGDPRAWNGDLIPDFGLSLGNIRTDASLGATLRAGWRVPKDFHSLRIDEAGYAIAQGEEFSSGWRDFSAFAFFGLRGNAVIRDIFLDGNTFRDGPSVTRRPWVGTLVAGIGVRWHRYRIAYAHVMRSLEFEQQDSGQEFGSITLTCFF